MCGIAGIISQESSKINEHILTRMGTSLAHRGPDGKATWISNDGYAGFSHRRLTVIDTSEAAAQPMHYAGSYTIIHNGEIYNYIELREELKKKGYEFKTVSDTEVILAAYAHYREKCVEYFEGMFSFAIWDDHKKILFCARDRFGEKPFYYTEDNGFYFASEIKTFSVAGILSEHDNGMLLYFLGSGNTIDPSDSSRTFYRRIKKLPASHWLKYDVRNSAVTINKYWEVSREVSSIKVNEAQERLNELLTLSVTRRLRSDVPIGTSLSGGLDSSSIAACLWEMQVSNLKTFTASFPGFEKDEAGKVKKVADKFNLGNIAVTPTAADLANDLEKVARFQDEPIASASVYAQFRVFELAAHENVTVLLDGQGADEVLGGYDHYRNWWLKSLFPAFAARVLERRGRRELFDPSLNRGFAESAAKEINIVKPVVHRLNDLLYFDTFCAGLEQLLRYADRNSMAHSREVRLPFLNHELVSFAFSLPASMKIHGGFTKWLLRKVMHGRLPDEIVWTKRKTGFEPPQKKWMEHKGMQEIIMEARKNLVKDGILNKVVLDQRLSANEAFDRRAYAWRWLATSMFMHKKGV